MGQTIVEGDTEQTIGAIVHGLGGRATTKWPTLWASRRTIALNDQSYRTAGRLLALMPRLGAYHRA